MRGHRHPVDCDCSICEELEVTDRDIEDDDGEFDDDEMGIDPEEE